LLLPIINFPAGIRISSSFTPLPKSRVNCLGRLAGFEAGWLVAREPSGCVAGAVVLGGCSEQPITTKKGTNANKNVLECIKTLPMGLANCPPGFV
jgi:hypothetical protein